MKDENREAVWEILKPVCSKRTGPGICSQAGNDGNRCTAAVCPVVPKLMKASWPKPPLYPHVEPLRDER